MIAPKGKTLQGPRATKGCPPAQAVPRGFVRMHGDLPPAAAADSATDGRTPREVHSSAHAGSAQASGHACQGRRITANGCRVRCCTTQTLTRKFLLDFQAPFYCTPGTIL